jgi:uncharacterized protein YuzE
MVGSCRNAPDPARTAAKGGRGSDQVDRDADIAWLPTGSSEDVVSEEVGWGLVDHHVASDEVVAIEVWAASKVLSADLLERLPAPSAAAA